jgi:surface antigen
MYKLKLLSIVIVCFGLAACAKSTTSQQIQPSMTKQQMDTVAIVQSMNQQDKINAKHALTTVPVGQEAVWTNPKTKISYTIRPIKQYKSGTYTCRKAKIFTNIGKQAFFDICRHPDGKWYEKS